jgi:hypothetical protein
MRRLVVSEDDDVPLSSSSWTSFLRRALPPLLPVPVQPLPLPAAFVDVLDSLLELVLHSRLDPPLGSAELRRVLPVTSDESLMLPKAGSEVVPSRESFFPVSTQASGGIIARTSGA